MSYTCEEYTAYINMPIISCTISYKNTHMSYTMHAGDRWYRDPNVPVPLNEITRFPHAVLEIKLHLLGKWCLRSIAYNVMYVVHVICIYCIICIYTTYLNLIHLRIAISYNNSYSHIYIPSHMHIPLFIRTPTNRRGPDPSLGD